MKTFIPLFLLLVPLQVFANFDLEFVGARIGFDGESSHNFQSYEFLTTWETPWAWELSELLRLEVILETSAGTLIGEDESSALLHFGFAGALEYGDFPLSFIISSGPTYLTEDEFGDHELGGHLQFTSALGLDYECSEKWILGYRYQHISNAGLKKPNPGLNMHVICASYSF